MNWAERRKFMYMTITLTLLGMIGFLIFRQFVNVVPNCFDGRKNGDEIGIDCGGGCQLYCPYELPGPKVRWVRAFQISSTVTQAVAYIEHSNSAAASPYLEYTFKLYDEQNTVIAERSGVTFLGPLGRTAIVETLIPTGSVPVARTTITFTDPIQWKKIPTALITTSIKTDRSIIEQYSYSATQRGTRVVAVVQNDSRFSFNTIDVIAILYDKDDNVITASKNLVPRLAALSSKEVTFTWPFPLPTEVFRTEIVARFNPFTTEAL
ncbi:hypothetical protein K2Q02_02210 [Patescibacteria group bacterium]|nr:hypothetical protein [Patescibacteria group bacterium]